MHSSGSTGKPGYFVYDKNAWNNFVQLLIRYRQRVEVLEQVDIAIYRGDFTVIFPGVVVTVLFTVFGWLAAGKISRMDLTVLVAE